MEKNIIKSTTIVGIRKDNLVVIAGDGQASLGNTVMKSNVKKIRRLGGDEFVVLLLGVSLSRGYLVAERIRKRIEKTFFNTVDGAKVQVTTSIGVACCPDHGTDSKKILEVADQCMYESKKLGKNRVTLISKNSATKSKKNYEDLRRK